MIRLLKKYKEKKAKNMIRILYDSKMNLQYFFVAILRKYKLCRKEDLIIRNGGQYYGKYRKWNESLF